AYGFCWNPKTKEMFATDNGPDKDPPEELNLIEKGKHYGFPYQFAGDPAQEGKPYAHTPKAPKGLTFTLPIKNLGPDAKPVGYLPYTFESHSSPAAIIYLDENFPKEYQGQYLIARFGNFAELNPDVGFDVLRVKLKRNDKGIHEANVYNF